MNHLAGSPQPAARLLPIAAPLALVAACATPPDFTGFAANTSAHYKEDKAFYAKRLDAAEQHTAELVDIQHIFELDPAVRKDDLFQHRNPLSVVLQTVRLPEDLPTRPSGTIDVAVVLDIHSSAARGLTTLMAYYQRDVSPGQELSFANLLVYADPMWDEANPPYFRIRVLDVAAERNRNTVSFLDKVANLSGQLSGLVPHPTIPIVSNAIEAAGLVLGSQANKVIIDFQIQFYSQRQVDRAGGATLGPLVAGEWFVLGRAQDADATFWAQELQIERKTGRVVTPSPVEKGEEGTHGDPLNVPYVKLALVKADAEVPKLVLDRSESLLGLLSAPSGKSDVDALEQVADNLISSLSAYAVERRLSKYRSLEDLQAIIDSLRAHDAKTKSLNLHERRRLIYVLSQVTDQSFTTLGGWTGWWAGLDKSTYEFVEDADSRFGVIFRMRLAN